MAELTPYGFERDDLSTLIEDYKDKFRAAFGQGILLDDDSVFGQFAALLAERDNENQKLAEAVYQSKTLAGAEGIYLDDIYGRFGIFRLDKQQGGGEAVVKTNSDMAAGYTLPTTASFSADNGINYNPAADILLRSVVYGLEIPKADIIAGTYTVQVFNKTTSTTETLTHVVSTTSDGDVLAFFDALETFIEANVDTPASTTYVDTDAVKFYAGFDPLDDTFVGMGDDTAITISPKAGEVYHKVDVTAATAGVYPLLAGGIIDLTPSFTGYVQADNIRPFDEGEEVESDTAYRLRAQGALQGSTAGTREGLINALLELDGIDAAVIYDNPTLSDTPEADALTFNTVVSGGSTDAAIAQVIFDNKPVNTLTDGTLQETVVASDGNPEIIRFTRSGTNPVSVRINYSTSGNIPLSASEQNTSKTSLLEFFDTLTVGSDVYNSQLLTAFLSSVTSGRVLDATAEIKDEADPDVAYSTSTYVTTFSDIATLDETQIFFVQTLI